MWMKKFWPLRPESLRLSTTCHAIAEMLQRFDPAPTFLPLDLIMYNLAKRPPGPIKNNSGHVTRERTLFMNEYLQSMVGTDQSDLVNRSNGGHENALAM